MQTVSTICLDIGKSVFQVHGVNDAGELVIRSQLKRRYVLAFFQKLAPLLIRGFINTEFVADHYQSFLKELIPLVAFRKNRYREDITDGLASAPEALIAMLSGRNFGNTLVHVS